ncbi:MAG: hypothetical protein OEV42_14645 [Deltaproteobacteria bacterium]|nr:hypothetical protein [Deltaproteobacteria bacterium]
MEITEIEKILTITGSFGLGAVIGGTIIFFFLKSFLPSYLSEKGKNLATKEDVETITDKVESVKADYAKVIEEVRSNNQLKLSEIEREKNIKKEVFLEAIVAINRSHTLVARLIDININTKELFSTDEEDGGSIAKIQIVGSEKTVKATTKLMDSIATAKLALMLDRTKLVERAKTIELLEKYRTNTSDEIDNYISMLKNMNLEGIKDKRRWDIINNNIEFEKEERDKFDKDINEYSMTQQKEHLEFTKKSLGYYFEISSLIPDAVLSARDELNLKISTKAYLDIHQDSIAKGKRVFDDFIDNISS